MRRKVRPEKRKEKKGRIRLKEEKRSTKERRNVSQRKTSLFSCPGCCLGGLREKRSTDARRPCPRPGLDKPGRDPGGRGPVRPPKPPQPPAAGAPFGPQTPPALRAPGARTQSTQGARGSPKNQEAPGKFVERGHQRKGARTFDRLTELPQGILGPSKAPPWPGQRLACAAAAASPDGYKGHLRPGPGFAMARPARKPQLRVGRLTPPSRANKRRAQGRLKPPRTAARRSAPADAGAARQATQLLRRTA